MSTIPARDDGRFALAAAPISWSLFAVTLGLLLFLGPILLVEIPAMVDYPNHLARMSVLMRASTSDGNPFYEARWALHPNLAMDLVVPPLGRLLGIEAASRLFLLVTQALLVGGAMALGYARSGRVIFPAFVATLMLYSKPFAFGFVNFEFGLALALWGIAAWIALAARPIALRIIVHVLAVAILFVAHLFALGLYGFTIAVLELWRARATRIPVRQVLPLLAGMAAPAFALAVVLAATGGGVGGAGSEWGLASKLTTLLCLNGYWDGFSIITSAILLAILYAYVRQGWMRVESDGACLAAAFGLLYVVMPFRIVGTAFVDVRVVVAAALILPAFVRLRAPPRSWTMVAAAVVAMVATANLAVVTYVQLSYRSEYRALVSSFGLIAPGSRVLVGHSGDGRDPPEDLTEYPIRHAPVLAVHYANAFVPSLFAHPGKQPVASREPASRGGNSEVPPIPVAILRAIALGRGVPDDLRFLARWTETFEYLYVVGPPARNPMPERLVELASGARFTLYRLRADAP